MAGLNPANPDPARTDDTPNDNDVAMATSCSSSGLSGSTPDNAGEHENPEGKTQLLRELWVNQEGLEGTVKEIKATLVQIYRSMTLKNKEIGRLAKRVTELTSLKMKGQSDPGNLQENQNGEDLGACEIYTPIPILPEEVWEMILGKVKDPNDLWNLINTCQLFNTLLKGWKTGYMLCQALPHLYQHFPGEKLLKCRLVCKSWEAAVDTFLENHPSLRPHNDEDDPRHLNFINPMKEKSLGHSYNYTLTLKSLREYNSNAKSDNDPSFPCKLGRNPLIGRACILHLGAHGGGVLDSDSDDEDGVEADGRPRIVVNNEIVTEFWDYIHKIFTTYGRYIWYLTIDSPSYNINHPMYEKLVQIYTVELYEYAPNLRKLTLQGEIYHRPSIGVNGLQVPPAAPNLESIALDLSWTREFPEALIGRYHMQLRGLEIRDNHFTWEPLTRFEWPLLAELNLNGSLGRLELASLYEMRMPQLKKLVLKVTKVYVNFAENILELIRKLSGTTRLSVLRLEEGIGYLDMGWHAVHKHYWAPVTLKTLEIDMGGEKYRPPFTFLLRFFPHLENLFIFNVKNKGYLMDSFLEETFDFGNSSHMDLTKCQWNIPGFQNAKDTVEVVEVNKFANWGNFYDSNIWELLINLKVFAFEKEVYTRHGYEEHLYRKENSA